MENSLLRVPLEIINKNFRLRQKQVCIYNLNEKTFVHDPLLQHVSKLSNFNCLPLLYFFL